MWLSAAQDMFFLKTAAGYVSCLLSVFRWFNRVTPSKTTIILRSSSKFTPSALFPSLSWRQVDDFSSKKLVGGWFPPNWKSSLKIPKIFETTTSCNYLWMCFWTFSHNLCVVWFFCASPTLLLLYWWLQSFVSIIQHVEVLNGTGTSGTPKFHNFHSDIATYQTSCSNVLHIWSSHDSYTNI